MKMQLKCNWNAKALAFLATFKKQTNPDKFNADG